MTAWTPLPHEVPPTGASAALADRLQALVPVLETARTRLRAMRLGDFPAWADIFCSERSAGMGGPYPRDEAFNQFGACVGDWLLHGHGFWTVEARTEDGRDGAVLGFVGINMEPSNHETELGYCLLAAAEGRGLAREAAAAVRDWAWGQGFASLVSYADPANARSAAVARALGAARDPQAEAAYAGTPDADVAVWRHPRPEGAP